MQTELQTVGVVMLNALDWKLADRVAVDWKISQYKLVDDNEASHRRAVAQHCINGDWRMPKFDPL